MVLNEQGVVLGRLRQAALNGDLDARVEDVMELGPTTARPDVEADSLLERLRQHRIPSIVITASDGRLVGTFWVAEAELAAEGPDCCLCSG